MIKKKKITTKEANELISKRKNKEQKLLKLVKELGIRFHGSKESSLEKVRKKGLKKERSRRGATHFGDASLAHNIYAKPQERKLKTTHSISEKQMNELKKKNKVYENFRAGSDIIEVYSNIPPERIKTFITNIKQKQNDPLLWQIEKQMSKEGKTMRKTFEVHPAELQHEINYYSLVLADDAYEKHNKQIKKAIEQQLKKEGRTTFTEIRKETQKLGIPPELQNQVIGSVFLDLNLKKSRRGFTK